MTNRLSPFGLRTDERAFHARASVAALRSIATLIFGIFAWMPLAFGRPSLRLPRPRGLRWLVPATCLIAAPAFAAEPPGVILDAAEMSIPAGSVEDATPGAEVRIPFAVFDPDSEKLAVAAASGNQSIIANGAIRVEGEGEQRTLVIDEVKRSGNLVLTIAVYDGEQWEMGKIDLTVGEGEQQQ